MEDMQKELESAAQEEIVRFREGRGASEGPENARASEHERARASGQNWPHGI